MENHSSQSSARWHHQTGDDRWYGRLYLNHINLTITLRKQISGCCKMVTRGCKMITSGCKVVTKWLQNSRKLSQGGSKMIENHSQLH